MLFKIVSKKSINILYILNDSDLLGGDFISSIEIIERDY